MNADIAVQIGVGVVAGVVVLVALFVVLSLVRLWLEAVCSGAQISMMALVGMKLRRVDARRVVRAKIIGVQSGVSIPTPDLERAYLLGADLELVTLAYIDAKQRDPEMTFDQILDAERSGRLKELLRLTGRG